MANVAVITPKCQGIETLLRRGENICWGAAPWVAPIQPNEGCARSAWAVGQRCKALPFVTDMLAWIPHCFLTSSPLHSLRNNRSARQWRDQKHSALSQAGSQLVSVSRYKRNLFCMHWHSHRKCAFSQFLFVVKYAIFFSFKGNPIAYLSFSDYGCSLLLFGDVTGKPCLGLMGCSAGLAAGRALPVQQPSCAFGEGRPKALWSTEQPWCAAQRETDYSSILPRAWSHHCTALVTVPQ